LSAGGAVWHFVHGSPVALAMAGFADAGGVATASIPNASTDNVTVATAARTSTDLTAFEFCIVEPLYPNRLLQTFCAGHIPTAASYRHGDTKQHPKSVGRCRNSSWPRTA
jgi:hypothetical protein